MKTKTIAELNSEAKDMFSFILVFCPSWPSLLKQMSTAKAFNNIIDLIHTISDQTKSYDAKQWLRVCLQEIRQSWKHYEDGNLREGRKLIQRAEEHFKSAFSKKSIEARFVVGESSAALDSQKGFPS